MICRIPQILLDPDLWRAMAQKRGEAIASLDLADAVITIAPPYADETDIQKSIDDVLQSATAGRVAIRLVPDQGATCYSIGGGRYALEVL